jgi:hypothetical protein
MQIYLAIFAFLFFPLAFFELLKSVRNGSIHIKGYKKPFVKKDNPRDFWFVWSTMFFIFLVLTFLSAWAILF